MPTSEFPRFEVIINGETKGIGGMERSGFMRLDVTLMTSKPYDIVQPTPPPISHVMGWLHGRERGVDPDGPDENTVWGRFTPKPGDEITIRILEPGEFDEPERKPARKLRDEQ